MKAEVVNIKESDLQVFTHKEYAGQDFIRWSFTFSEGGQWFDVWLPIMPDEMLARIEDAVKHRLEGTRAHIALDGVLHGVSAVRFGNKIYDVSRAACDEVPWRDYNPTCFDEED